MPENWRTSGTGFSTSSGLDIGQRRWEGSSRATPPAPQGVRRTPAACCPPPTPREETNLHLISLEYVGILLWLSCSSHTLFSEQCQAEIKTFLNQCLRLLVKKR